MTLDALIEQQLSLGKKLGDIKVKLSVWKEKHGYFIPFFKCINGVWHGLNKIGEKYSFSNLSIVENDWHLYTEPKKFKKYWLWNMKNDNNRWYKNHYYLDDNGRSTNGKSISFAWDNIEKQKLENEFIEIEVEE